MHHSSDCSAVPWSPPTIHTKRLFSLPLHCPSSLWRCSSWFRFRAYPILLHYSLLSPDNQSLIPSHLLQQLLPVCRRDACRSIVLHGSEMIHLLPSKTLNIYCITTGVQKAPAPEDMAVSDRTSELEWASMEDESVELGMGWLHFTVLCSRVRWIEWMEAFVADLFRTHCVWSSHCIILE